MSLILSSQSGLCTTASITALPTIWQLYFPRVSANRWWDMTLILTNSTWDFIIC
jgi:hypothetical protein